jgi:hypothetical protein
VKESRWEIMPVQSDRDRLINELDKLENNLLIYRCEYLSAEKRIKIVKEELQKMGVVFS